MLVLTHKLSVLVEPHLIFHTNDKEDITLRDTQQLQHVVEFLEDLYKLLLFLLDEYENKHQDLTHEMLRGLYSHILYDVVEN